MRRKANTARKIEQKHAKRAEQKGYIVSETMAARGLVNGRGPQHKKMSWKVGVYSCLSGRLIGVWEG